MSMRSGWYQVVEMVGQQKLPQGRYLPGLCASFGAALNVARDAAEAYMTCGHYLDNPRWVVVDPSGSLVTTVQP